MAHNVMQNTLDWQNHSRAAANSYNQRCSGHRRRVHENIPESTGTKKDVFYYYYGNQWMDHYLPFSDHDSSDYKLDFINSSLSLPLDDALDRNYDYYPFLTDQAENEILEAHYRPINFCYNLVSLSSFMFNNICSHCCGECGQLVGPSSSQCCCPSCGARSAPCALCGWRCCQNPCFGQFGPCGPCGPQGRCGSFEGPFHNIKVPPTPVAGLPFPGIWLN